eukprot:4254264-Pleurochrysis_carterae.AAC.1
MTSVRARLRSAAGRSRAHVQSARTVLHTDGAPSNGTRLSPHAPRHPPAARRRVQHECFKAGG